jgi:hypothetical protein
MFLYTATGQRARVRSGHKPTFLIARDTHGREIDKRPIQLDRAAGY